MEFRHNKILVTGSGGLLGERVADCLMGQCLLYRHYHRKPEVIVVEESFWGDLTERRHLEGIASMLAPDIIVNCAALADVDRCEREPELSRAINVDAVQMMLEIFPEAKMVQISTDYVFPNREAAGRPDDEPQPMNIYGRHKLAAERAVLGVSPNHLVLRTNTTYDFLPKRNFFLHVYENLKAANKIQAHADQISNPISAVSSAAIIMQLMIIEAAGIIHMGGRDFVSRHDFAGAIAEVFELDTGLIEKTRLADATRDAVRPAHAGLDCSLTEKMLDQPMPSLHDDLERLRRMMIT